MFKSFNSFVSSIYNKEINKVSSRRVSTTQKVTDVVLHVTTSRETDAQLLSRIEREHEEYMNRLMNK